MKPNVPAPLEADLMQILMKQPTGAYGASLARDYEALTGRTLSAGTAYVTLERTEKKGFTKSAWGEPTAERGGRRKRMYVITAEGRMAMTRLNEGVMSRGLAPQGMVGSTN